MSTHFYYSQNNDKNVIFTSAWDATNLTTNQKVSNKVITCQLTKQYTIHSHNHYTVRTELSF